MIIPTIEIQVFYKKDLVETLRYHNTSLDDAVVYFTRKTNKAKKDLETWLRDSTEVDRIDYESMSDTYSIKCELQECKMTEEALILIVNVPSIKKFKKYERDIIEKNRIDFNNHLSKLNLVRKVEQFYNKNMQIIIDNKNLQTAKRNRILVTKSISNILLVLGIVPGIFAFIILVICTCLSYLYKDNNKIPPFLEVGLFVSFVIHLIAAHVLFNPSNVALWFIVFLLNFVLHAHAFKVVIKKVVPLFFNPFFD